LQEEEAATSISVDHSAVAELEKRRDMDVSNPRRDSEALGGTPR
jgi:serine/threonine protein phosphatase PrpC